MRNVKITFELEKFIGKTVATLLKNLKVKRATKYVKPNLTIKATRRFSARLDDTNADFVVTVGRPNYKERKFIKDCEEAEVQFPIHKIQLQYESKKKAKKKSAKRR